MAYRFSRRDVLRMAGGVAVALGPTSLLVSLPGCGGGDDDGGGSDAGSGGDPDGGGPGGADASMWSNYGTPDEAFGCYQIESYFAGYGYNSYDDFSYYYYYYQFACLDSPQAPWSCYYDELPDHHYLCYTSQYYYTELYP